jgi:hypothetical protein
VAKTQSRAIETRSSTHWEITATQFIHMRHLKEMRNHQVIFHLDEMHDIHPSSTRPQGMQDRQLTARTHTVKCFIRKEAVPTTSH